MASLTTSSPWAKRAALESRRAATGLEPTTNARPRRRRPYVITVGALVVVLLVNVPLLNALWTALKTNGEIQSRPPAFFFQPTLSHFEAATYASGYDFPHFFLNSLLLSIGAAALVLVISVPSGYAIVRLGLGRRKLIIITTAVMLVPPITFALPFYMMFDHVGLVDTVPALIFADTFVNLPLGLLLVAGFLRDLPLEIEEAALVDGCSHFAVVRRVVFPLMGPAIAAVAILTLVFSWDDFLFAVILSASAATPVTVGAANFITSYGVEWGDISAATVMSVVPPLILGFAAQRYLVRGLTMGAVKG
jgi:multiple sugar transport system permease protein